MKIAIDALPLVSEKMTGIGHCEAGQLVALSKEHPDATFSLQYFERAGQTEKSDRLTPYLRKNVRAKAAQGSGYLYRLVSSVLPFPSYRHYFGKDAEITHFFNYMIPPGVSGKKVVTVHDMVCRAFPGTVRGKTKWMLRLGLKKSMRRADCIVTDSEFSKTEIIRFYPKFADKIRVVPCGVDTERFHPVEDTTKIDEVKAKYGLDREYFLYLGTIEPRKNLARLIEAFALFVENLEENETPPYLVLAGGKGWLDSEIYQSAQKLGIEPLVKFTEYLPDADITPMMCGAIAFLFPSLYEGFGMPPLEAMACGVPVLTTTAASLPEVVRDAALCVDPYQVDEISAGIEELYGNAQLRAELSEKGRARAATMTWENAAAALWAIYTDVLNGGTA